MWSSARRSIWRIAPVLRRSRHLRGTHDRADRRHSGLAAHATGSSGSTVMRHPNLTLERSLSIAFVATCPPRQCGIATFSSDLERALKAADPSVLIQWAAINEATSIHPYGPQVRWRIRQGDPDSYRAAAEHLNVAAIDVVSLQHEFGLYGAWGDPFEDHLVSFLEVLDKPLVTTLHSVLPDPSPSIRE